MFGSAGGNMGTCDVNANTEMAIGIFVYMVFYLFFFQRQTLGEDGLKTKKTEMEMAMQENEKPAPDSVLERFSVPSISSIHYHDIQSWNNRHGWHSDF